MTESTCKRELGDIPINQDDWERWERRSTQEKQEIKSEDCGVIDDLFVLPDPKELVVIEPESSCGEADIRRFSREMEAEIENNGYFPTWWDIVNS